MAFQPNFPKFIEILRDGAFAEKQAMSIARAMNEVIVAELVTTHDLRTMVNEIERENNLSRDSLKRDIADAETRLETKFEKEIASLRHDLNMLFYRLGGVIVATIIGVAAFLNFLKALG